MMRQSNDPPRSEVVEAVVRDLLMYLDEDIPEDLSPSELLSTVFTLALHVSLTILDNSTSDNREHNRNEILAALSTVYTSVKPSTIN